jgi:carboxyl-terminal processing protease
MYRNSRLAILLPILLAAAVVLGLLLGRYLGRNTPEAQLRNLVEQLTHPTNKLAYTLSLIETEYVDSVSMDSLSEQVIPLLMEELDPHSVYIPKSEMEAVNEPLQGEFDGIGVVFNMAPDTVIVLNVIPSGPSDKAGVKAGDRIIRINDSLVAGQKIPNNEIVKRLRGKRGTQVKLSLERQGIAEPVEVEVTRGAIPIKSLEAAFMLPDSIGYIKLSQFAITSHNELITALNNLKAQGMKRLIFDLRGNPGGFLDQAIRIANEFLPADKLIVYTEDRNHNRTDEMSDGNGTIQELPLAVLIDEFSASSSEILAGALQDNDRGTIIGRRSFGKGLVQRQIPYPDGSALRLTVARYYTPTGRSIQKPYTNGDALGYEEDLWNRYRHNEFFSADSIHFADSLKRVTPGNARRQSGLRRRRHHARPVRAGRYDRRNPLFPRGVGTQHPLPLYARIRRPSPRRPERREDHSGTPGPARCRQGADERLHPIRSPQRRTARLQGHRPLAQADRSPVTGLHRTEHPPERSGILREYLPDRPRHAAGGRSA